MIELISETTPKARKQYSCDASVWLNQDDWWRNSGKLSFTELREIAKAKANNWKIQVGDVYLNQVNKQDGDLMTFRAIPAIHKICLNHNVYEY